MSNQLIPTDEFQTEVPVINGIQTVQTLNTSSPSNNNLLEAYQINTVLDATINVVAQSLTTVPDLLATSTTTIADIPPIFYTTGTCFENLNSAALITNLKELYNYLCEVLIRFDSAPRNYQQEDYAHLIKTITNSLIYLYTRDTTLTSAENTTQFIGAATITTNPFTDQVNLGYKFPGIYICGEFGVYTNFGITIVQSDLISQIILLVPVITNGVFVKYIKETVPLEFSLYTDSTLSGYGSAVNQSPLSVNISPDAGNNLTKRANGLYAATVSETITIKETPIGVIDNINRIFQTSRPFNPSSVVVFINGLSELNFTVINTTTIQLDEPLLTNGFTDTIEILYTLLT
jgi:hypothetical protein